MIFTLRTRPPCTKTAALFAGTEGLLVLIYAKMFNYWIIISRFWRLSTGKLGVFRLFGDGGRPGFAGRGCGPPTFLWVAPKEKSPPQRWKRKALGVQILPVRAGLDEYGGRASRCGGDLKVCAGCARALGEQGECFPAFGGLGAAFGVVIVRPPFLFPRSSPAQEPPLCGGWPPKRACGRSRFA